MNDMCYDKIPDGIFTYARKLVEGRAQLRLRQPIIDRITVMQLAVNNGGSSDTCS